MNARNWAWLLLWAAGSLLSGCTGSSGEAGTDAEDSAGPPPPSVVGDWEVYYIEQGGQVLSGPGFRGTVYHFRDDDSVFSVSGQGKVTVAYKHEGDSLHWLGDRFKESYQITLLSEEEMHLFHRNDRQDNVIRFRRFKP